MKKVKYIATMVVEFEVQENEEKVYYPEGLNEQALIAEMKSDTFSELFENDVKSFHAEGFLIEDDAVIATHKEKIFEDC
ncbi:hypothetical protein [Planococcus sp. YIM B11945]|uniref:hypothetical protein n=1 Tax=Planococcus sp. YIM B11945 TaxID=3435410 RepID=UPI003D7E8C6C